MHPRLMLFVLAALAAPVFPGLVSRLGAQGGLEVFSDGSDGDFAPTASVAVDLSQAPTGAWDGPNLAPGKGVYDAEKWAVVFRYRSVDIPSGVAVTYKNHPSRAPVVWLVEGDVSLDGSLRIFGQGATFNTHFASEPGPGGFRGGYGHDVNTLIRSGGFGPGGGVRLAVSNQGGAGSHATAGGGTAGAGAPYGNARALPLAGGSGGGGGNRFAPSENLVTGGAGGGAILIAAGGTLSLTGNIDADGGSGASRTGAGSGGAVRLIAARVVGNGFVSALGGSGTTPGGTGYVRVETFESTLRQSNPPYTLQLLTGSTADIWPPAAAPRVRVTRVFSPEVGNLPVPADARARFDGGPNADVSLHAESPVRVEIAAENVPLDWTVTVRVVPRLEDDFIVAASRVNGNAAASLWQAEFLPPSGIAAVQARADAP